MSGEIAHMLMSLRDQIKIYHWQTSSYSRHVATNDLVTKLDASIDEFVEVYIGKYGRPKFTGKNSMIHLRNFQDAEAPKLLDEAIDWLSHDLQTKLKKSDSDLFNIRDTIVANLNQVKFLFALKK
jgi:hypothetical protein